MSNAVLVIDSDRKPCDPIPPAYARVLLGKGKAAVFRRYPFTIILKHQVNKEPMQYELKLDPGSQTTGFALVRSDGAVVFGAELEHRGQALKKQIETRAAVRGGRRSRNTRYREARFDNRTKPEGWLAPSLQHRVLTTMTWVNRLLKVAPIHSFTQELVKFDTQKMNNPEISGVEYQRGDLSEYEVKEYLLEKWGRKCVYCGKKDVPLEKEHIHPKANGGSNRVSNLTLACRPCNQKKDKQSIQDFLKKKPKLLAFILACTKKPLKDAAAVNSTRWALCNELKAIGLEVKTGSGAQTKWNRKRFSVDKEHWKDAACAGTVDAISFATGKPLLIKATGKGNRRLCRIDSKGFPCSKPRQAYQHSWKTGDMAQVIKKGISYTGRVVVQSATRLEVRIGKQRLGGKLDDFKKLFSVDGYKYEKYQFVTD